ncbi:hypothetical protein [Vibrio campbellii]|uniref:hypothetical protein n=1 Tax=Vibrio campbellii TaxID=680 RepID=UPI0013152D31|nr:hypothetical protein [Vibrio campbellii]
MNCLSPLFKLFSWTLGIVALGLFTAVSALVALFSSLTMSGMALREMQDNPLKEHDDVNFSAPYDHSVVEISEKRARTSEY